jgi:hypothetical protein
LNDEIIFATVTDERAGESFIVEVVTVFNAIYGFTHAIRRTI